MTSALRVCSFSAESGVFLCRRIHRGRGDCQSLLFCTMFQPKSQLRGSHRSGKKRMQFSSRRVISWSGRIPPAQCLLRRVIGTTVASGAWPLATVERVTDPSPIVGSWRTHSRIDLMRSCRRRPHVEVENRGGKVDG